ncbi:MAG: hypothetical protein ACOYJ2_01780 [Rickettsiales bacterium]
MDILTTLYVAAGMGFAIAFIPQIITLWRDKTGAASINLSTWAMFAACSAITLLYAIFKTDDPYFMFCASLGVIGNSVVLLLALSRRTRAAAALELSEPIKIPVKN